MRVFLILPVLIALAGCAVKTPQPITQKDADSINFPSEDLKAQVDALLPAAIQRIRALETRALDIGSPLTDEAMELARELGVQRPEKIRVVVVKKIPKRNTDSSLLDAEPQLSLGPVIAGITTGYGIYLADAYADQIWVFAHELVHVAQHERLGLEGLARQTITEQLALPGRLIPVEREAIAKSAAVLGIEPPPYAF